ncbi:MAG: DNA/RNA non-specific endonuclease [Firmicutes bacterium]|nr:DNA/RNA non-specific endonuclease [Bacillota bacterium]
MARKKRFSDKKKVIGLLLALCLLLTGCIGDIDDNKAPNGDQEQFVVSLDSIPEYTGELFVEIGDGKTKFSRAEKETKEPFEIYSELDELGRCGVAYANICLEIMPDEKRGSIGKVKPTGWHTVKYDHVDGKYLYNRCHLIGFQLAGENANEKNLITGTRYMNVEGMLRFENMVADHVKEWDHHVLYRVTPIFKDDELVARGVQIEAFCLEDEGGDIDFNVYVYNVQPGIEIDYETGDSRLSKEDGNPSVTEGEIRGNSRSKIYHCPGQAAYEDMADSKNLVCFETEEEAQKAGYRKAKR